MNATGTPANLLDRPERSALDLPVAGLAALAVAFVAFTIPDALLGRAVEATGLPELLTAAQPPLGNTARLSIAATGAAIAFFATFILLGWLERFGSKGPVSARAEPAQDRDMPRINKADAHPDAPPRRPISALRDLGEPAPPPHPRATESCVAAEAESISAIQAEPPSENPFLAEAAFSPVQAHPAPPAAVASAPRVAEPSLAAAPSSLGELMARLEQGLVRREQEAARVVTPAAAVSPTSSAPSLATASVAAAAPAATPSREMPTPRSDRLQTAIDGLRALSA